MRKNESDAAKRVAGPIPFYDANGQLKKNLTFDNGSAEVYTYRSSTNDWVAANTDTTELGGANTSGMYLLQLSQAETNYDSIVGVKLVKATYEDQFWFERVDNTPDVNVVSETVGLASDIADVAADVIALQADVDVIQGLLHNNAVIDNQTYDIDTDECLSARIRVFASQAAAIAAVTGAANNADGETQRYLMTAELDIDGKVERYQLTKAL